MLLKEQNYGGQIELTGITRRTATQVIANYYGTSISHSGGIYDTYNATDRKGGTWKAMSDASIRTTHKENGVQVSAAK